MQQHYTIGFAGHVDHGKTTLVKCLTGIDTDRRPEEKRRGLSIEAGVAPLRLPSGNTAAVVDVPGHVDFLKNTIRGLNGVDLGVLVIAADDGVMPQTLAHLEIMKFFKAASGLVILSKTDLVDDETVDIAEMEVRDLLGGTFLDHETISRFTATKPEHGAASGRIRGFPDESEYGDCRRQGAGGAREKFRIAKADTIVPLLSALKDSDLDAYVTRSFDAVRGGFINARGLSEKTGLPLLVFERRALR